MELTFNADVKQPVITTNFEALKAAVAEKMKEYEVDVTYDNLAESKKLVTELNKFKTAVDSRRKELKKEILAPYIVVEEQAQDINEMISEAIEKIKTQVNIFENEKRNICLQLLEGDIAMHYMNMGIEQEYQTADVSELVMLSSLTPKGLLTKAAMDKVQSLAIACKARQDLHQRRMMQVENLCLKAGILPLNKLFVSDILDVDESIFLYKAQAMVDAQSQTTAEIKKEVQAQIISDKTEQQKPVPTSPDRRYVAMITMPFTSNDPENAAYRIRAHYKFPDSTKISIREMDAGDMED